MKKLIKLSASMLASGSTFDRFISILERADGNRPDLLPVLTYHRIDEPKNHPDLDSRLISATPKSFKQQMEYLAANYHILSMSELLDLVSAGEQIPSRTVMVTFDDAYCDFIQHAWPILQSSRIPVTLFVPTAYPGHPGRAFWWDRLHYAIWFGSSQNSIDVPIGKLALSSNEEKLRALNSIKKYVKSVNHWRAMELVDQICDRLGADLKQNHVLDWDGLRKLVEQGVTLGAHTRSHPLLNRISLEEARDELVGSLQDLHREIGQVPSIFAYPGGGLSDEVVAVLRSEGIQTAFTTVRGINDMKKSDPLQLRRINVGSSTTMQIFRAQLLPQALHLNALWSFSSL